MINDPTGSQFYGGQVAAPLFSTVMSGALRLMDIPPDNYEGMFTQASADVTGGEQ
jgi:cell division protein FtsI (penicillin-binding protein 3)